MIARHERMRLGPGLPVFAIGMHADTARCLLQAPDRDAEVADELENDAKRQVYATGSIVTP